MWQRMHLFMSAWLSGLLFFFSSRRRHTRWPRDWSSDVCSSDLLASLGGTLVWTGEFDQGERWLERAAKASQGDAEPGTILLLHLATAMLHVSRGKLHA